MARCGEGRHATRVEFRRTLGAAHADGVAREPRGPRRSRAGSRSGDGRDSEHDDPERVRHAGLSRRLESGRREGVSRPLTLFTGQWADLPLTELAPLVKAIGYDGMELACWG